MHMAWCSREINFFDSWDVSYPTYTVWVISSIALKPASFPRCQG